MGLRTTLALLLLLLLVGGAYLVLGRVEPQGRPGTPEPWPDGFRPLDATELLLYNQHRGLDQEMRFEREAGAGPWRMTFPRLDEADSARIGQILDALQHNPWQFAGRVSSTGAEVLAQMGLADAAGAPSGRGFLRIGSGGRQVQVYLGGPDVDERVIFVRIDRSIWRTPANLWSAFDHNIEDFRSPLVFALSPLYASRMVLERAIGAGGEPGERLEFFRDGRGRWMLREGELESHADEATVENFLATLASLRIQHIVGDLPAGPAGSGADRTFFRIELEGAQGRERLNIGEGEGSSVLAWREGRPFLLLMDFSGPLPFYLQGRGLKLPGPGADFRKLRLLSFPGHAPRRLEIRGRQGVRLAVERVARGEGWDLVHPWRVAARDGAVEALLKALGELKALSVYPASERATAETGLDQPAWTWELVLDGFPRPLILHAGRGAGQGVYMALPGEEQVFFVPGEALTSLLPDPLELPSLLVLRLLPHQFQIVRLARGERTLRLDRDMDSGLFRLPGGALAGEAWEDLVDGLADLSALRIVSTEAAALEREPGAFTILFHRNPIDPAAREPGRLEASVRLLQGAGGESLAWRPDQPFVYQVPSRLWELASRLAGS